MVRVNVPSDLPKKGTSGDVQEKDGVLLRLERAEKRVIAASFLLAKIVGVSALLLTLIILEAGVVISIFENELHPEQVPSRFLYGPFPFDKQNFHVAPNKASALPQPDITKLRPLVVVLTACPTD